MSRDDEPFGDIWPELLDLETEDESDERQETRLEWRDIIEDLQ